MLRLRSFALLLFSACAACGGSVVVEDAHGGGGAGGAGPTGTTSSTTSNTTTTTTTGTGGAPACGETYDGVVMELATWDGHAYGCGLGMGTELGEVTLQAAVVESDGLGTFTLESCPPNVDCGGPMLSKVSVSAPGLYPYAPQGAFIELRMRVDQPWGCMNAIQIKNLPVWAGVPNPYPGSQLWLVAADGEPMTFDDTPFAVETEALGCYPDEPPQCDIHEDYTFRFRDVDEPGNAIVVPMGETFGYWTLTSGAQSETLAIRNLRSFSSGWCDDYWNWAYWVMPAPLEG